MRSSHTLPYFTVAVLGLCLCGAEEIYEWRVVGRALRPHWSVPVRLGLGPAVSADGLRVGAYESKCGEGYLCGLSCVYGPIVLFIKHTHTHIINRLRAESFSLKNVLRIYNFFNHTGARDFVVL